MGLLTSTPHPIDNRRQHRSLHPSRPATARQVSTTESTKLPKRPATGRNLKSELRQHDNMELLTPRTATVAIQEAIRRERTQEHYVDPLIGRSVEPRGHLGRERKTSGVLETNTIAMLSRARVVTTAAMNATERLRIRAFQARANGEYDGAINFYKRLSTARPSEIEAKFHLAVCLERTGQYAQALAAYKQVQRLSGDQHALAYYNMGNLCMRADKIPKAIDYFSRAIAVTKDKDALSVPTSATDSTQCSGSSIGSTPIAFYRQRAAAYRKNGDFENAAQDYVLVQKCTETASSAALAEENAMFTAEHLYQTVKRAASPRNYSQDRNISATMRTKYRRNLKSTSMIATRMTRMARRRRKKKWKMR